MNQEKNQEGGESKQKKADIDQEKFHVYHNAAIRGNSTEKIHKTNDQSNDDVFVNYYAPTTKHSSSITVIMIRQLLRTLYSNPV